LPYRMGRNEVTQLITFFPVHSIPSRMPARNASRLAST
jgi:hypothetical protein